MKTFKQFLKDPYQTDLPFLDEVFLDTRQTEIKGLLEGRTISGRFPYNIRLDQPNYGAGMYHAHIHGRKGDQLVAVNVDGSGSHGTKGKLHPKDADALRAHRFEIHPSNIVEWFVICSIKQLLLE